MYSESSLLFYFGSAVVLLYHVLNKIPFDFGGNDAHSATSPAGPSEPAPQGPVLAGELGQLLQLGTGAVVEVAAGVLALVHELPQNGDLLLVALVGPAHFDELEDAVGFAVDVVGRLVDLELLVGLQHLGRPLDVRHHAQQFDSQQLLQLLLGVALSRQVLIY